MMNYESEEMGSYWSNQISTRKVVIDTYLETLEEFPTDEHLFSHNQTSIGP